MNPRFSALQPYPFERFRELLEGVVPNPALAPIDLSIGEPRHPTPALVRDALIANLDGLGQYPPTLGSTALREAIAGWLSRRFAPASIDPATQVLPVLGSREALFALTQTVIDASRDAVVISPNPFYQIYEGAALLAGARMHYVAQTPEAALTCAWDDIPAEVWTRTQLVFVCTPGNPTGSIVKADEWNKLFDLSDKYGFVIASDECYSELYPLDSDPPLGGLQAAAGAGRDFRRLIVFGSLSKRSNSPGLRSGYVAGDPAIIREFLRYRTYHGSAMSPPVQAASVAAWQDETHVRDNRALYEAKYTAVVPRLAGALTVSRPAAGFYLWARSPHPDDLRFGVELLRQYNVRLLPGSLLGRTVNGSNPGSGYLRIALVAPLDACIEAAGRIGDFCRAGAGRP